jgi:hypothetical protein
MNGMIKDSRADAVDGNPFEQLNMWFDMWRTPSCMIGRRSGAAIFPYSIPILCEDYPAFDLGRQDVHVCIPGCMLREKPPPDSA